MKKIVANILPMFMVFLLTFSVTANAQPAENQMKVKKDHQDDQKTPEPSGEKLAGSALPIVQSYKLSGNQKNWTMNESTRIAIPDTKKYIDNTRLQEVVELVSAEFLDKKIPSNKEIQKVYAEQSETSSDDIVVMLDKDIAFTNKSSSEEAYKINIGDDGVKITAASENAAMYALRTIQQLMVTNHNQLAYGTIIDYPDLSERRLHVDMARKYITKDWIIQHIREMSYFKMNAIQLHFSENLGFRIESDFDPSIVSKDGYLTKKEVKEILAEAHKYGVKVIPSLDTPGHVDHILKVHPEYGQVDIDGNHSKSALDVTNPDAIDYIKGLYSEYMDLFEGSTDFNIGADEYMEFDRPPFTTKYKKVLNDYAHEHLGKEYTWKDTMADYVNDIAEFVHARGFKPRIFNDGVYYGENSSFEPKQKIKMHDYIGIDFWSQMPWNPDIASLKTFIEKGHKDIYNLNSGYFYYVLRNDKPDDGREQHSFDYLNQDKRIYEQWTPGKFAQNTVSDDSDFIKGASLAIWNDNADLVEEDVITDDIAKELRSLATKSWNVDSNKVADIQTFRDNYKKLGNVAAFEKGSDLPKIHPVLPVEKAGIENIKELVEKYEANGKIVDPQVAHKLDLHLTAVAHFVDIDHMEKATKHMKNFKRLIIHYNENNSIEKQAAKKLKEHADFLIMEWNNHLFQGFRFLK